MYEKIEHCPVCSSSDFTNEIICNDHTVTNEKFAIVKCDNCQFLFTNPRPDVNTLEKYYDSDLYISHNSKGNTVVNRIYKFARFFTLRKKEKLIKRKVSADLTLLDYGCGTGHFISYCSKKGWNVSGVEPNNNARTIANGITKNNVVESIEKLNNKSTYQIITLWHVLEHVPDLNILIKKLTEKLDKKGSLIIAVPNPNSLDAKIYKQYWAGYDVPRHLYHFTQDSIKQLMK
ncbi:MAG: class I SAM-dependent methyltransferase, partial [Cyclobacteriaceae bacterium]|nr:class I SAM-dependent methyltransferase [Cyclobacteriaceae bacterium]